MPETESEEEDTSEAVKHNNRESKIFFDVKTEKEVNSHRSAKVKTPGFDLHVI